MAYQLMQRGEIRTVRIGAARRVRREDLSQYIQENLSPLTILILVGVNVSDRLVSLYNHEPYLEP